MKENLPNMLKANQRWVHLLIINVIILLVGQSAFAQRVPVPCTGPAPFTIIGEDASSKTSNNAKMRISGGLSGDDRVGYSVGTTYTGTAFAATAKLSTFAGGYLSQNLPTPTVATGTNYTIRVYKADTTCYYDKVFNLEYVNFNETPKFPDLQVTSGVSGGSGGYYPLGSTANVSFAVQNAGDTTATNVKITLNIPAGLTLTGNTPPAGTSYNATTKEWTIGTIAKGDIKTLLLQFTVGARGLSFVSANTTTEENVMLSEIPGIAADKDSQPGNNITAEDDYGSVCISSPYDFCVGDEYKITIASGNYTGIKWFKGSTELTSANAAAEGVVWNGDGTITVKSEGIYRYEYPVSSCPTGGCCPIKVEAGVKPNLAPIADKTICLNGSFGTIGSTLSGYTGPTTLNPNGPVIYQWFNNNGTTNPTNTQLTAETNIALGALPTAVGVYKFKLVAFAQGHPNCKDSVMVTLTINALPEPVIASNSPVCAEGTIELTATPSGATNYIWSGPAGFTGGNIANPKITNAIAGNTGNGNGGTYNVTITNGVGCSASTSVVVIVNPLPEVPKALAKTLCAGDPQVTLTADIAGADFLQWYGNNSTGGNGSTTADFITPTSAGVTRYYVSQKITSTGCESHRSELIVTVNEKPATPKAEDKTYCQGVAAEALKVTGVDQYTFLWYGTNSTGGTTTTTPVPLTNTTGTTIYYVSQKNNVTGCESNRDDAIVIVNRTPSAPTVDAIAYCQTEQGKASSAIPLTAGTENGNTVIWYNGGSTSTTAPTPTTTTAGLTYYYVSQSIPGTGCESGMSGIPVTVNPLPVATVVPVNSLCVGTVSQNNAKLILTRYRNSDEVSYNIGTAYTAPPTATAYTTVPAGGLFATNLNNPTSASQDYTVRIKNSFGCTIDRVATLTKTECGCPGGYCEPATVTKTK